MSFPAFVPFLFLAYYSLLRIKQNGRDFVVAASKNMARSYLSVLIIYGVIIFNMVPLIDIGNARVSFTFGYCTAWASPYALCQHSIG